MFFLEEIKAMFSNLSNLLYAFNKHVPKLTCIKFTYKVVICNFNRFTARRSRGHPSYSREVLKFFWNLATFSLELSLTSTKWHLVFSFDRHFTAIIKTRNLARHPCLSIIIEFLVLILKNFDVNTPHKEKKVSFCFDNLPTESRIEPFCGFQEVEHQRTNQHTRFWRSCICEVVMEICSGGLRFWTAFMVQRFIWEYIYIPHCKQVSWSSTSFVVQL